MEIWQGRRKFARRNCVGAALAVLLLLPCAVRAESIRPVGCAGTAASTSRGAWIEPTGAEVVALCPSAAMYPAEFRQASLCEVWTEPTLRAVTWRRAKSSGIAADLQNLRLAPEPSGAVLASIGVVLAWRRLRSKLRA
jgi:hypothetical protein